MFIIEHKGRQCLPRVKGSPISAYHVSQLFKGDLRTKNKFWAELAAEAFIVWRD